MAKPIEATPTLRGKDAIKFLKDWEKERKHPSPGRVKFIRNAEKNKEFYLSFIRDK